MNFFESELKKIMHGSGILKDQKYVGRKCYGVLDDELRGCVEFVTLGTSGNYGGIKVSLLNRKEGQVDSMLLRFSELLGKKKVNNLNFKEGIVPHIWENGTYAEWYVYQPTSRDYESVVQEIENYLSIFLKEDMEQKGSMQQVL